MTKIALLFLIAVCVLVPSTGAYALPAPMSPGALFAASDLVALVRVLSVTCMAISHHQWWNDDQQESEDLRHYTAELGLLAVRKGKRRACDVVKVRWDETPKYALGPWYVPYYPGGEGWTYLKSRDGVYETTWWNATDGWRRIGDRRLPQNVMETRRCSLAARASFRMAGEFARIQRRLMQHK
jgi:hypothetical protein